MNDIKSLCHSVWDCKYHVVFIPKCRRRVIYGTVRKYLGEVFRNLARQRECTIEEGHLMSDHYLCAAAHKTCYAERSVM